MHRDDAGLVDWHARHVQRVRSALRSARCAIEVNVESPTAGEQLAHFFNGTNPACWRASKSSRERPLPSTFAPASGTLV